MKSQIEFVVEPENITKNKLLSTMGGNFKTIRGVWTLSWTFKLNFLQRKLKA